MTVTAPLDPKWETLAQKLFAARRGEQPLGAVEAHDMPGDFGLAYDVQDRLITLEGGAPRFWKLGAPTHAGQKGLGLSEPFSGPMFEAGVQSSPARYDTTGYAVHLFEPEIAVTLRADLACHDRVTRDDAQAAIGSMHPAVEIINWRTANTGKLGVKAMIADYAANGGFVLAPPCPSTTDYWNITLDVRINGRTIAERTPPAEETDPAALVAWCARHLGARGYKLKAGDVITTGSQAGVLAYAPGDFLEADFGAAGIVRVQF